MQEQDQVTVEGTVSYVAVTGGIKLKEFGDQWFNPAKNVKSQISKELVGKQVCLVFPEENSNLIVGLGIQSPSEQPLVAKEENVTDQKETVEAAKKLAGQERGERVETVVTNTSYGKDTVSFSVNVVFTKEEFDELKAMKMDYQATRTKAITEAVSHFLLWG